MLSVPVALLRLGQEVEDGTVVPDAPPALWGPREKVGPDPGDVLRVGEGSLYPALQRLQVKDLVAAEWRPSDTGRRARYYRLTALGRRQLEEERDSYERVSRAIAQVLEPV